MLNRYSGLSPKSVRTKEAEWFVGLKPLDRLDRSTSRRVEGRLCRLWTLYDVVDDEGDWVEVD